MNYFHSTLAEIARHESVVFQFSGGRDSLAALRRFGKSLPKNVKIVYVSTGDEPQETKDLMDKIRAQYGAQFLQMYSDSRAVRAKYGHPLPIALSAHPLFAAAPATQTQVHCCFHSIMAPAARAVETLRATMVIRGQRFSDEHQSSVRHLDVVDGITYAFPAYDCDDEEVNVLCGELLPSFYEFTTDAPDCMTCTGYWGRGYQKWLEHTEPQLAAERRERIAALLSFIEPIMRVGFSEIE